MSEGLARRFPSAWMIDLPDLAVEVEVVDIEAAQVGLEHAEDVGDRDVEPLGLGAIESRTGAGAPGRRTA